MLGRVRERIGSGSIRSPLDVILVSSRITATKAIATHKRAIAFPERRILIRLLPSPKP